MSQAKVDRYKEEKANRAKIMARQKRNRRIAAICGWVILAAVVCWAGYSAYGIYERSRPVETIYADLSPVNDYLDTLDTEE